ncbi:MAG TPA: hypothetical protein VFM14_13470 [Gemmatimonadales bacterium]|nr:hypothetical protein [Gemmatimonadales bacterium]
MRFIPLFRAGAWVLVAAGAWYLWLAARSARDGTIVWRPLAIMGVAALAVGTSLLIWFHRSGPR